MAFARDLLIYGIGGAASRLAAIVLVPLYTRALPVEAYGRLELLLALLALGVLIVGLQGESALARDLHQARAEGWDGRLVAASLVMVAMGTVALAVLALAVLASGTVPGDVAAYFPLVVLAAVPSQVLALQLVILRFSGAAALFGLIAFLDLASAALFSTGFILIGGMGIEGALLGILAGKLSCMAIAWHFTFRRAPPRRPGRPLQKAMLAYALPTLPAVFLNWLQANGSRLLLAIFLTFTGVAIAGIAIKIAALYAFIAYSFRLAWEPISFQMLATAETRPDDFNVALESYVVIMLLIAGLAMALSPLIVTVLAPAEYAEAAPLAGMFIVGQFWTGAMPILAIGVLGARRTSRLTPIYLAGAATNVGIIVVLAPYLGIEAAALGSLLSGLVGALLAARSSQAHYPVRFSARLLSIAIASSSLLAAANYLLFAGTAGLPLHSPASLMAIAGMAAVTVVLVGLTAMLGLDRAGRRGLRARLAPSVLLGKSV
jgi:O-antigen/teichoic acid export membrane protein